MKNGVGFTCTHTYSKICQWKHDFLVPIATAANAQQKWAVWFKQNLTERGSYFNLCSLSFKIGQKGLVNVWPTFRGNNELEFMMHSNIIWPKEPTTSWLLRGKLCTVCPIQKRKYGIDIFFSFTVLRCQPMRQTITHHNEHPLWNTRTQWSSKKFNVNLWYYFRWCQI